MQQLVELLKDNNQSIASMESFTGGCFASELTSISGASKVFKGGLITYSNETKIKLGQIDEALINKYGAISSECALMMAEKARQLFNSDFAVSFTGNAGPTSSEDKPVGLVYSSISNVKQTVVYKDMLEGNRHEIREKIVLLMVQRLKDILGN